MNPLGPRLPDSYVPCLYVPVYSLDGGVTWIAISPCTSSTEAKNRLRSALPAPYRLRIDKEMFKGLKVGCVGIYTTTGTQFAIEFVSEDFIADKGNS